MVTTTKIFNLTNAIKVNVGELLMDYVDDKGEIVMISEDLFKRMPNPRLNQPFDCFSEQFPKIPTLKFDPFGYLLTVPAPTGRGSQAGLITIPTLSQCLGERGCKQKGGGGFSGPKDRLDTDDQPYLTLSNMS